MQSNPERFLTSERLGFVVWEEKLRPWARRLYGCDDVTRLIGGPFSQEQIDQRFAQEIAHQERWGVQYWPMVLRETNSFVGCCGLHPYQPERSAYELGFHLLPEFWGQGLGTEAASAVIQHAFTTLEVKVLVSGHHPNNERSGALLQKLGFDFTHDAFYEATGLRHPMYILFPQDWRRTAVSVGSAQ